MKCSNSLFRVNLTCQMFEMINYHIETFLIFTLDVYCVGKIYLQCLELKFLGMYVGRKQK